MRPARSLYGWTKYASESLIEEYRAGFGLRAVTNRCSVIAGPWQMGKVDQGVVALWVFRHYFGKPLKYIGYGGTGKQVRDMLHVADLCDLVTTQISHFDEWEGWLGNVGGGQEISASLLELTGLCRQVIGREVPIGAETENRPADLRLFLADCSKLFARTAWRPKRDVKKIVADVFEWVRAHEKELQPLV
jgi:CDP-paratose 2-epimerase